MPVTIVASQADVNDASKTAGVTTAMVPRVQHLVVLPDAYVDGEYLLDNYYNMKATMVHEERHDAFGRQRSSGSTSANEWEHFDIQKVTISDPRAEFEKTTHMYKKYIAGVLNGYLVHQEQRVRNATIDKETLSTIYENNLRYFAEYLKKYNIK